MELILNNDQTKQLETELAQQVLVLVKDGIQKATKNTRPYLNRKEIAEYLGVAPATINHWASLGMPVAIIDGRKLYGKESVSNWLKSKEKTVSPRVHRETKLSNSLCK